MIQSTRQDALSVLAQVCDLAPDVRLGQLLAHLSFLAEDQFGRTLWDIEDQQLLDLLHQHRAELTKRQEYVA